MLRFFEDRLKRAALEVQEYVRLVSAGHAIAAAAQRLLATSDLEAAETGEGRYSFLCTGDVHSFRELGGRFLQMPLGEVESAATLDA